ncbi:hypothetical protein R80B4_01408 [Fibrobacteres bacterium R8-0-B4]
MSIIGIAKLGRALVLAAAGAGGPGAGGGSVSAETAAQRKARESAEAAAMAEATRAAEEAAAAASAEAAEKAEKSKTAFTDSRDKKTYKAVKIGNQTWMAQNLGYAAKGSVCYAEETGDDAYADSCCAKYGRLYDWKTALTVCPKGWRLPSREDWTALIEAVGTRQDIAGKYLKSRSGWDGLNGKDEFGFLRLEKARKALRGGFSDRRRPENRLADAYTRRVLKEYVRAGWDIEKISAGGGVGRGAESPFAFVFIVEHELQPGAFVVVELFVAAYDRYLLGYRLGDDDSVGGVFVVCEERQTRERPQVLFSDVPYPIFQPIGDISDDVFGGFPLFNFYPSGMLEVYQLLHAFRRDVDEVALVSENSPNFRREQFLLVGFIDNDVRIDQVAFGVHLSTAFQSFTTIPIPNGLANDHAPDADSAPLLLACSNFSATSASFTAFFAAGSDRLAAIILIAFAASAATSARGTAAGLKSSDAGFAATAFADTDDRAVKRFLAGFAAADTFADTFAALGFAAADGFDAFLTGFDRPTLFFTAVLDLFINRSFGFVGGRNTVSPLKYNLRTRNGANG